MKRSLLEQILLYQYRYAIGYIAVLLLTVFFLFWRLGTLLPGLGFKEASYLNSFATPLDVLNQPLYWPHKIVSWAVGEYAGFSEMGYRAVSAGFAILALWAFFSVIRSRFRTRIALVAVALLATSSWWLGFARSARPEILMPLAVLSLMWLAKKAYENPKPLWILLLSTLVGAAFYIPLMPYVILVGLFALRGLIIKTMAGMAGWLKITSSIWLAVLLLPLIIAIAKDADIGRQLLGWPEAWPSLVEILKNVYANLTEMFWSAGTADWSWRVGTLPLLDLFAAIMLVLGLYYLDQEVSRSLAHFVLIGLGALLVLTSLDPATPSNLILAPFVYTLVAAGIVMLFSQWYEIFPRNPIARLTAFIPTILLIGAVVNYHYQRYFVAWAGSPEIIEEFPPLSQSLNQQLASYDIDFVVVTEPEVDIAEVVAQSSGAKVTAIASATDSRRSIIFSHDAFLKLEPEVKAAVEDRAYPVSTAYTSVPISLWRYQPAEQMIE